jgi:hypothetical protein
MGGVAMVDAAEEMSAEVKLIMNARLCTTIAGSLPQANPDLGRWHNGQRGRKEGASRRN